MSTAVKLHSSDARSIPFQEASLDIWDKKYRLSAKDGTPIDRSMDDTYKRFIERRLREDFGFVGSPVHVEIRPRQKRSERS